MQKLKNALLKYAFFRYLNNKRVKSIDARLLRAKRERDRVWEALFAGGKDTLVYPLQGDTKINLYKDSILSRLIYEGNFERNEINFAVSFLRPGDIFVDIGANIGLFSLLAAGKIGAEGAAIAFEPSPVTFSRLNANIALNGFKNIETRNIGLSNKKDVLRLNISQNGHDAWDSFAANDAGKHSNTVEVPVFTLDDQLEQVDKSRIALVKMDVEGWEKYVLEGAAGFFGRFAPAVMVEFTEKNAAAAGYKVVEIYDLFESWGYTWHKYVNGKITNEKRRPTYIDDNLIAVKDLQVFRSRLA